MKKDKLAKQSRSTFIMVAAACWKLHEESQFRTAKRMGCHYLQLEFFMPQYSPNVACLFFSMKKRKEHLE